MRRIWMLLLTLASAALAFLAISNFAGGEMEDGVMLSFAAIWTLLVLLVTKEGE